MFDEATMTELVDRVALRVVELLDERRPTTHPRLVDVADLAEILGVSPDTIYRHQAALGVVKVGSGLRPTLRFEVERACAAWTARCASAPSQESATPAATGRKTGRPRRATGTRSDLLPIRGGEIAS